MVTVINKSICSRGNLNLKLFLVPLIIIIYMYSNSQYRHYKVNGTAHWEILGTEERQTWRFRPRATCNCSHVRIIPEATEAGIHQRVISYTFFKGRDRNYTLDLEEILPLVRQLYPNWYIRLYAKIEHLSNFCELICSHQDILFFCPIEFLDHFSNGKYSETIPSGWRFLPLMDETVRMFHSRDLDSRPDPRELDAVMEWRRSGLAFHAMRDHPYQTDPILAGMWGADNDKLDRLEAAEICNQLVFHKNHSNSRANDQRSLEIHLYRRYWNNSMFIHDSYLCLTFRDSHPFPTRRKDLHSFVGKPIRTKYDGHVPQCPLECRPKYGKNWTYC